MNPIATYFDALDSRIKEIEKHLADVSASLSELHSFFSAAPAMQRAAEHKEVKPEETPAPVETAQAERAPAAENETALRVEEKSPAPAEQAQAERAKSSRGDAPTEADFESVRARVSAVIRGTRPGAADVAQMFRDRIREGSLWPVSACTTWERFDKLAAFLNDAGV